MKGEREKETERERGREREKERERRRGGGGEGERERKSGRSIDMGCERSDYIIFERFQLHVCSINYTMYKIQGSSNSLEITIPLYIQYISFCHMSQYKTYVC